MPARQQRDVTAAADIPENATPSIEQMLEWLQADAITFRDAAARIRNRWAFIRLLGEGRVPPDIFRDFNLLSTCAAVYFGTENQPQAYPFDEALAGARRGL
jgi:hypothetical protein